jgi:o-succinylbenzoate synthase
MLDMSIQQIEAYSIVLRYHEPFRIAPSTSTESHNIVVKIYTDYGVVGVGEASPSKRVTHETPQTVLKAVDRIAPRMVGMQPLRIEQIAETMDQVVAENPSAKAAIDMALHDILGKTARRPLFELLGGFRQEVLTDITLGIKEPEEMASDAVKVIGKGFRALKVKVGVNPEEDFERIRGIRKAVGSDVTIRIDANQGWTVRQSIEVLKKLERLNVEFVEQPVKADDIEGLAEVKKNSSIPVMVDESIHSPEDAIHIVRKDAADIINIKLMKSGGILKARKISAVAEAANMPCMIGCMGESTIGITAGVHLAAAVKNVEYADLDSDILLKDKTVLEGGAKLNASKRIPLMKPGLGIAKLDEVFLGKPVRTYK